MKYSGKGTRLEVLLSAVWTLVAQVTQVTGPSARKDAREITGPHHVAAGWREYRETLRDGGDVTAELTWDPGAASHDHITGLFALLAAVGPHSFRIVFPDSGTTTATFAASVVFHEPSAPADGRLSAFVTLKVSGPLTWS